MTNAWKRIAVALCAALMVIAPVTAGSAAWPGATATPEFAKEPLTQLVQNRGGGGGYRSAPTYRAPTPSYSPPVYRAPSPAPAYRPNTAPSHPSSPPPQRFVAPPARIAPPPAPQPTFARPFAPPIRAVGPIANSAARFGLGTVQTAARPQGGFISRFGSASALTVPAFTVRRNANVSNNAAAKLASVGAPGRATSAFNKVASASISTKASQSVRRVAAIGAGTVAFAAVARTPIGAANDNTPSRGKSFGGGGSGTPVSSGSFSDRPSLRDIFNASARTVSGNSFQKSDFFGSVYRRGDRNYVRGNEVSKSYALSSVLSGGHTKALSGPKLSQFARESFKNGTYRNRKLAQDEIFYKYHGINNRTGLKVSWFTKDKYETEDKLRKSLAIDRAWGVTIDRISTFKVPRGTWVSEGLAAPQGAGYEGGDYQAVVTNAPRSWVQTTKKAFDDQS